MTHNYSRRIFLFFNTPKLIFSKYPERPITINKKKYGFKNGVPDIRAIVHTPLFHHVCVCVKKQAREEKKTTKQDAKGKTERRKDGHLTFFLSL